MAGGAANHGDHSIEKFASDGTPSCFALVLSPVAVACDAASNVFVLALDDGTIKKLTPGRHGRQVRPDGTGSTFASLDLDDPLGLASDAAGDLYVTNGDGSIVKFPPNNGVDPQIVFSGLHAPSGLAVATFFAPSSFFRGEVALSSGVYYLAFPDGIPFGHYSFLSDPRYLYHFDLGDEYVFDADDGKDGVYFYDLATGQVISK